ncbi:glycine betaine ABC transporter substrate-binding protein [Shouchella lonarensis]|uniref:Glycine betaine/proline transport system substrate-binding protein n=1 Tax=Shouchella lonarensis TaxID=1464122 RepID=A0A1G6GI83_9BACI|nr:glycine betaine ABC transporter substrate-binding protein [Shouchella lonarensis]SDB81721.1 glycine betaine/proline transport system substrate-binding protein [Shouchella lonarensis]
MNKKWTAIIAASSVLFVTGCNAAEKTDGEEKEAIELVYVAWESEVASNHVIKEALEQAGVDVTLTTVEQGIMWSSVAEGKADGFVAAWLPNDMKSDYETYGDKVEDLGANLEGAKTGLAVPAYMDIESIADLHSDVVTEITGIDAGAGIMTTTEEVVEAYGLEGITLIASTDAMMTAQLDSDYQKEEPIVITAWQPHWKFQSYDLKFLEDPKGIYEANGEIRTMVRHGLKEDAPISYKVLDQFYWTPEEMNEVMLLMEEDGLTPEEAAKKWVNDNQARVDEWLVGIKESAA